MQVMDAENFVDEVYREILAKAVSHCGTTARRWSPTAGGTAPRNHQLQRASCKRVCLPIGSTCMSRTTSSST
eukprot:5273406-Heterocapsa_arctica.AAC.1